MMSEKRLRELRGGTIPVAMPAGIGEQTSVMPEVAFESYGADHRQAPELGADGRVRLAGGALGGEKSQGQRLDDGPPARPRSQEGEEGGIGEGAKCAQHAQNEADRKHCKHKTNTYSRMAMST